MNDNYIIAEIIISEKDVNKDIRIINSYEGNKVEYVNEKELKENCEIKINDNIIPFSYFYKFEKVGKYEIKYIFKKNMVKTDYMFYGCNLLTNINLSNFNIQNITNMSFMFSQCEYLTKLDLSNFKTENVINMSYMFYKCKSLKSINLSNINTQNVKDMSSMFKDC